MNRNTAWRMLVSILFGREDRARHVPGNTAEQNELWRMIIQFSDAHLVTPAVWAALNRNETVQLPEDVRQYLWAVHELNSDRNRQLITQLDETVFLLNRVGIVPVLLKGAAYLKRNVFSDAGARMITDLDIWIEPSALRQADEVLRSAGYRESETTTDYTRHHHLCPMVRPQSLAAIELHHRLLPLEMSPSFPEDILLKPVTVETNGSLSFCVLSPEHMVILSFLHSHIVDGFYRRFTIGLRPLLDLATLTSRYANDIDLSRVACLLRAYGFDEPFRYYLYEASRLGAATSQERVHLAGWIRYAISRARVRWTSLDRLSLHEFTFGTLFRRLVYGQ